MKRRIKVFSAIASLCLAVALMAFGVYAAAQVTYTINGTVNYTATDVLAKVETTVEYVADSKKGYDAEPETGLTEVKGLSYTASGVTVDAWQNYDSNNVATGEDTKSNSVAVNFNNSSVWKITIKVSTPQTQQGLKIAPVLTGGEDDTNNYILVAREDNTAATTVAANSSSTLVYYVYLVDPTIAISSQSFSIALTLTRAA